ncbi:MAG: DUF1538 domain-containing protein [bacterium]|nr:DUF1538 domain-containing protein [bacterium]
MFLFGTFLLIIGMSFFMVGSEISMEPLGEGIGIQISKTKQTLISFVVCMVLGILITIAEPDLQVLAEQVPSIPNMVLILCVAVGVGIFLSIAMIRTRKGIPLTKMLLLFYTFIIVLAFFAPSEFVPTAFDSGGVTTGPITVPFIMALGTGMATMRGDKHSGEDSFGLVSLCSIGPILSVLILSICYNPTAETSETVIPVVKTTKEAFEQFFYTFPEYGKEVMIAIFPIGMMMGYFIVSAEPAVHSLKKQVVEVTNGAITQKSVRYALSIGVAASVGISMLRVLTGIPVLPFLIAGYIVSLVISFFVPPIYTGIAFDSGGVASGPMTTTFMLPFAVGACEILGGNVMLNAFGIVAMIAMTPLITIQVLGLSGMIRRRRMLKRVYAEFEQIEDDIVYFEENCIWEMNNLSE